MGEIVCMETTRALRRMGRPRGSNGGYHSPAAVLEERVCEGVAIGWSRVEADRPELAVLRSAHAGVVEGLRDLDDGLAALITGDVEVPAQLLVAQSQLAGVRRALAELLRRDLEENREHRALIDALVGRLPDGA